MLTCDSLHIVARPPSRRHVWVALRLGAHCVHPGGGIAGLPLHQQGRGGVLPCASHRTEAASRC